MPACGWQRLARGRTSALQGLPGAPPLARASNLVSCMHEGRCAAYGRQTAERDPRRRGPATVDERPDLSFVGSRSVPRHHANASLSRRLSPPYLTRRTANRLPTSRPAISKSDVVHLRPWTMPVSRCTLGPPAAPACGFFSQWSQSVCNLLARACARRPAVSQRARAISVGPRWLGLAEIFGLQVPVRAVARAHGRSYRLKAARDATVPP
ncbi:hypothetical protein PsYK624_172150 [Phanerochaete sordida]|uniref:Uncharacterized protein n=1 Tax=Phanerochaete sordida TaxID=48140 RepID=A0A9P3GS71_9APHY|nr:hypothetical protein PsYK624_172150 [Phanerochaete sordida]